MAKGDNSKASNQSFSWENGALNLKPVSAEGLNSAMRGDIQAGYLRGPAQTEYVGMSQGTKDAMAGLHSAAVSNTGLLDSAKGYYQGVLGSGGLTDDQRGAMSYLQSIMDGSGTAPGYDTLRQNAMDDARTAINRQFGASGRFGAGSHVQDLGRGVTDAVASLDYQNYQNDLSRRIGAASSIFDMGQTGQSNAAGAASGMSGLYSAYLTPHQIAVAQSAAADADAQARAAFDPVTNHLQTYSGLLSGNAAGPQPASWMDYLKLGGGILGAVL